MILRRVWATIRRAGICGQSSNARVSVLAIGGIGTGMTTGPLVAFANREPKEPGLEVRINFGMLTGREATAAEIEELAQALVPAVGEVSIVAEERHEIGEHAEASLHQVVVEVDQEHVPPAEDDAEQLSARIVEESVRWAHSCAADRQVEIG